MEHNNLQLNKGQQYAYDQIMDFVANDTSQVFILRGYAGTGKTTLMKRIIQAFAEQSVNFRLLASTGRAAKILSDLTGYAASTVHSEIYSFGDLNVELEVLAKDREKDKEDKSQDLFLQFELKLHKYEEVEPCVYIIDEASMISDNKVMTNSQARFGSGRLLADLFESDKNGKYIFVGDQCQLPPINQDISPALSTGYIARTFQKDVKEAELTQIMRQQGDNDIPVAASKLRNLYLRPQPWQWAKFPLRGYAHIHLLSSQAELYSRYIDNVKRGGYESCTLICKTNRQCDNVTGFVRPALLAGTSSELKVGDILLVTQNNLISGLMNGDLVVVEEIGESCFSQGQSVGNPPDGFAGAFHLRKGGLSFLYVTVRDLYRKRRYTQYLVEDVLYQNTTNITPEQNRNLFIDFYYRMKDRNIHQKSKEFKQEMCRDPFLNALRCTWGYALTCHKAQGGEWDTVYLDLPRNIGKMDKPAVYQWIYTAMTRASKDLYLVNDFYVM